MAMADMPPEVKQFAAFGGSFGALFYTARWLIQWATARFDRRQAALDAEHAALDGGWREYRTKLEARINVLERGATIRDVRLANMRLAFELVAAELRKADPSNSALRRAEQLLAVAFPLEQVIPTAIATAATIAGLDHLADSPGG